MFGDESFDRIVREFFGENRDLSNMNGNGSGQFMRGEEEERNIDLIQTDEYIYVIFELPGYKEKEVRVDVKGNELRIIAKAKLKENDGEYLTQKLQNGEVISKMLPKFIVPKGFKTTFRNGVLELVFKKK